MDHWPLHARQWARIGPPLRPSPEDLEAVRTAGAGAARALLLGATPELAALPWPSLTAVDHAREMLDAVFPHGPGRTAVVGDWLAMPVPAGGFDLVLGDGCASCLPYPDGYRALAAELVRVLAPGGRVVLRLFASPPVRDVAVAPGGGFHAFKWRLAMQVASDERNVAVADIWAAFAERFPDRAALALATGWAREQIDTIDVYRGSTIRYSFPTEAEALAALAPLRLVTRFEPSYELGERCPTVVLAP